MLTRFSSRPVRSAAEYKRSNCRTFLTSVGIGLVLASLAGAAGAQPSSLLAPNPGVARAPWFGSDVNRDGLPDELEVAIAKHYEGPSRAAVSRYARHLLHAARYVMSEQLVPDALASDLVRAAHCIPPQSFIGAAADPLVGWATTRERQLVVMSMALWFERNSTLALNIQPSC